MHEQGPTTGPLTADALNAFMARSETPMLLTGDDLRYRGANPAACRLFGLSHEGLLALSVGDLTPKSDQDGLSARVAAFRDDGTLRGVVIVIGAGGAKVKVEFSAIANVVPGLALSLLEPLGNDDDLSADGAAEWSHREVDEPLSPREREVLSRLALGETGEEIADTLCISPHTVRRHVSNARKKLSARTRAQAVVIALRRGDLAL